MCPPKVFGATARETVFNNVSSTRVRVSASTQGVRRICRTAFKLVLTAFDLLSKLNIPSED